MPSDRPLASRLIPRGRSGVNRGRGGRPRRRAGGGGAVEECPGLGLERVQLLGPSGLRWVRMVAPPLLGAIEVGAGLGDAAEPIVSHGQEKEVEGVGRAL